KATEMGVAAQIPSVGAFRELVASGVKVSPMEDFFQAVGFDESQAKEADLDYQREFAQMYDFPLFGGVEVLLDSLASEGLAMGIVTSNNHPAVEAALAGMIDNFKFVYTKDQTENFSKSGALVRAATLLRTSVGQILYVGD